MPWVPKPAFTGTLLVRIRPGRVSWVPSTVREANVPEQRTALRWIAAVHAGADADVVTAGGSGEHPVRAQDQARLRIEQLVAVRVDAELEHIVADVAQVGRKRRGRQVYQEVEVPGLVAQGRIAADAILRRCLASGTFATRTS
jgi:hypothetical protein